MAGSAKPYGFAVEGWLASPYRPSCGVWSAGSSSIPKTRGRGLTVSRLYRGSARCIQDVEERRAARSSRRERFQRC